MIESGLNIWFPARSISGVNRLGDGVLTRAFTGKSLEGFKRLRLGPVGLDGETRTFGFLTRGLGDLHNAIGAFSGSLAVASAVVVA